jgi:hypothetical protein
MLLLATYGYYAMLAAFQELLGVADPTVVPAGNGSRSVEQHVVTVVICLVRQQHASQKESLIGCQTIALCDSYMQRCFLKALDGRGSPVRAWLVLLCY